MYNIISAKERAEICEQYKPRQLSKAISLLEQTLTLTAKQGRNRLTIVPIR